jgi:hypothetical protein
MLWFCPFFMAWMKGKEISQESFIVVAFGVSVIKKFYNIDTWAQCYKTFYGRDL